MRATGGSPEALGRILRRAARRLDLAAADEVVGIVDGAAWIRNQLQRLGHCDHIGLDYYHFSEHVSEAARICFGEGSHQAAAWRKRVLGLAVTFGGIGGGQSRIIGEGHRSAIYGRCGVRPLRRGAGRDWGRACFGDLRPVGEGGRYAGR